MKKNIFRYLLVALLMVSTGLTLNSCKEDTTEGGAQGLSIKVYAPTRVIAGQEVSISGTLLNEVTEVVFPGDISVTDIKVTGPGLISVITPVGVQDGELVVKSANDEVAARVPMTVGSPFADRISPSDEVGVGADFMAIGTDMLFIDKMIFPGLEDTEVVVNAIDFVRKSDTFVTAKVPGGIKVGPSVIKLVAIDGTVISLPEVLLTEVASGPVAYTNAISGVWIWDDEVGVNGVYGVTGTGVGFSTGWAFVMKSAMLETKSEDPTNTMIFTADGNDSPKGGYTKVTTGGEVLTSSSYVLDFEAGRNMSNGTTVWSIGTMTMEEGAGVLIGQDRYNTVPVLNYEIHRIVESEDGYRRMVLFHVTDEGLWGQYDGTTFWMFKRVPDAVAEGASTDLDLYQGQTVDLKGTSIKTWWIDPDWFGITDDAMNNEGTTYIFKAIKGKYRIIKDDALRYVTVEVLNSEGNLASLQADGSGAVWIKGTNTGKPSYEANNVGFSISPATGICMTPIGGGKYRTTFVAGTNIPTSGEGDTKVNFKFFSFKDQWTGEFTGDKVTTQSPLVKVGAAPDNGNIQLADGVSLSSGTTYEVLLDVSAGTGVPAVLTFTAVE